LMDGHLRRQQERISREVLDAVRSGSGKHRVRTLAWLCSSKIEAASERQADPVSPKRLHEYAHRLRGGPPPRRAMTLNQKGNQKVAGSQ
jgi:hypothetical protein